MYSDLRGNSKNQGIKSLWDNNVDGEVIVGERNEVYPIRILADGRNEGTNTVYRCELMGGITTGIPVDELLAGKRFSVEYAPVEKEFSRKNDLRHILVIVY